MTTSASHIRPAWLAALLLGACALVLAIGASRYAGDGGGALHLAAAEWQTVAAPGFSPAPDRVEAERLPPGWRRATLPLALPDKDSGDDGVRVTWVRLAVDAPPGWRGPLALYGVRLKTNGGIAIYADGRLVYLAQQQGPLWNSLFTPTWAVLDQRSGMAPPRQILLRLEHTADTVAGVSSLWLGPVDSLRARHQLRLWLQRELPEMLSAAFLAVGLFALAVWLRRRHETSYLLFFYLGLTSFVAHMHYYVDLPLLNDSFGWLTLNSLYWLVLALHFFLRQLHGQPLRWLTWTAVAATAVIGIATLPPLGLPNSQAVLGTCYAIALLLSAAVALAGGYHAWRRSSEGRLVDAGLLACVLLNISDWLGHNDVIGPESWFLGAYSNGVTFLTFGALMVRRYLAAIAEVEHVNASLAHRLREREAELEESHRRLRESELRQTISDERQRLMQDMHDGLGSSLISAIRSVEHEGGAGGRVSAILKDCLDDLRLTIDSLEPAEADLLLLLATLRYRLEPRLESAGVALHWEVRPVPPLAWLEPSAALHILRIVQEGIANVLHHSGASEIRVSTAAENGGVLVEVADNGAGFDMEAAMAAGGHGLRNQQRRAAAIDAAVAWRSGPGGTVFSLWLPLVRG
ncbi:sensor histidine kinase [Oxalobacteraceae bacterium A2-2]